MEMFDLKEEYKTLPNETLRKHYKKLTKRQRRLSAITFAFLVPAMLVYGMLGWANFLASEWSRFSFFDASSNAFFNYVAFAASGALLMADTAKLIAASPAVYGSEIRTFRQRVRRYFCYARLPYSSRCHHRKNRV